MGEVLVIDTNIMKLVLKNGTEERKFVEHVLNLCDSIVYSHDLKKEYRSIVGLHRKKGWYPKMDFEEIWKDFEYHIENNFKKNLKKVTKSDIKSGKERLGIDSKKENELRQKLGDRFDYKLIECAIGSLCERVIIISRDRGLDPIKIKDITVIFMTPEEYLQERCAR